MRLLLDTHIWLWSLLAPSKLGRRARKELDRPGNELWLSPITTWEALVLLEKGRVAVNGEPRTWLADAIQRTPTAEAPLTHDVVLECTRFHLSHRDPADRFLVATARVLDLTLLTADARLLRARACPVLANR